MTVLNNNFIGTLHTLVRTPSVVGCERLFIRTLVKELQSLDIQVTEYDGLLVADGGGYSPYSLCAHVDRHGLITTGPDEYQYAAFQIKYKLEQEGNSVSEQTIKSIQNRFLNQSVFAYDPWSGAYIGRGTIVGSSICHFRSTPTFSVQGLGSLSPGTPIAFEDKLRQKEGWLTAQLDNVLSVAIIIELYRRGYKGKAYFSSQEEAGLSWRYLLDYFNRTGEGTDSLLILDTSPFESEKEVAPIDLVMRHKDVNGDFNKTLISLLIQKCNELGFNYIFKDTYIEEKNKKNPNGLPQSIGRTELGRLIKGSDGQCSGTTLQIPTYGYHTCNETCTEKSVLALLSLLQTILV